MNLFNSNLLNVENINIIKKEQKQQISVSEQEQRKDIVELTYDICYEKLFDKSNLPSINPYGIDNNNKFKEILDKIDNTLSPLHNEFWLNRIIITNTGNKELKLEDFYENDKLGFELSNAAVAITVNSRTKKYINASTVYNDKNLVHINFDTIEPEDSIVIDIISLRKLDYTNLYGKTKYFDAPKKYNKYAYKHDSETKEIEQETENKQKSFKFSFCIMILAAMFALGLSIFDIYLKHSHQSLYIRNPFVIKEVQNVK